jgi:hypothetical protein
MGGEWQSLSDGCLYLENPKWWMEVGTVSLWGAWGQNKYLLRVEQCSRYW